MCVPMAAERLSTPKPTSYIGTPVRFRERGTVTARSDSEASDSNERYQANVLRHDVTQRLEESRPGC